MPSTQHPLSIKIPGESPITTRSRLNEFIDRGFPFTGTLTQSGEPTRIVALRDVSPVGIASVVIGLPHETRFADVSASSIRLGR